ncbi:hypothetical protein EYF80_058104 [Liparis tanakae]|uniref:Uncharacterized protein n=1 Tax=Liparis tanakae TaxID=230148 RepID=A0A4Z2ESF5_9TELE|nr:hypothetical protein EYF80_058104 [Liparis tanakae]
MVFVVFIISSSDLAVDGELRARFARDGLLLHLPPRQNQQLPLRREGGLFLLFIFWPPEQFISPFWRRAGRNQQGGFSSLLSHQQGGLLFLPLFH